MAVRTTAFSVRMIALFGMAYTREPGPQGRWVYRRILTFENMLHMPYRWILALELIEATTYQAQAEDVKMVGKPDSTA